jgi:phage antirepressor YoqD-like protein
MRSLTEMNESLNQYLKLYCEESKKEVENELSRVKLDYAERIENLNEQI